MKVKTQKLADNNGGKWVGRLTGMIIGRQELLWTRGTGVKGQVDFFIKLPVEVLYNRVGRSRDGGE